jgi:PTS system cellobiose-specific IIC component
MKFVNTKAIQALQNGMIYTLPFILIGSIFLILGNIPIPAVANAINASGWGAFFNQAYTTTFSIMAMWAAVGIAYSHPAREILAQVIEVNTRSYFISCILNASNFNY